MFLSSCTNIHPTETDAKANLLLKQLAPMESYSLYIKSVQVKNTQTKNAQNLTIKQLHYVKTIIQQSIPFPYILSKKGLPIVVKVERTKENLVFHWIWKSQNNQTKKVTPKDISTTFKLLNAELNNKLLKQVTSDMVAQVLPYLPSKEKLKQPKLKPKRTWFFTKVEGPGSQQLHDAFIKILKEHHLYIGKNKQSAVLLTLKILNKPLPNHQIDITIIWTVHFVPTKLTADIRQHNVMSANGWEKTYKTMAKPIAGLAFDGLIKKINLASKS